MNCSSGAAKPSGRCQTSAAPGPHAGGMPSTPATARTLMRAGRTAALRFGGVERNAGHPCPGALQPGLGVGLGSTWHACSRSHWAQAGNVMGTERPRCSSGALPAPLARASQPRSLAAAPGAPSARAERILRHSSTAVPCMARSSTAATYTSNPSGALAPTAAPPGHGEGEVVSGDDVSAAPPGRRPEDDRVGPWNTSLQRPWRQAAELAPGRVHVWWAPLDQVRGQAGRQHLSRAYSA